jgi:hypothetical protein
MKGYKWNKELKYVDYVSFISLGIGYEF